jgi:Fe2+ transport system protein FeoA
VPSTLADLPLSVPAVLRAPRTIDATVLRLMEMGMTAGATVVVTRRAPLGDPIEIAIRGTRLCLRRADAAQFDIEKDAP